MSHEKERYNLLLDVVSLLIESSHEHIPLPSKKIEEITSKKSSSQSFLPGWKEEIAPLRNDSLFWHAVWISAGKPSSGWLH